MSSYPRQTEEHPCFNHSTFQTIQGRLAPIASLDTHVILRCGVSIEYASPYSKNGPDIHPKRWSHNHPRGQNTHIRKRNYAYVHCKNGHTCVLCFSLLSIVTARAPQKIWILLTHLYSPFPSEFRMESYPHTDTFHNTSCTQFHVFKYVKGSTTWHISRRQTTNPNGVHEQMTR